MATPTEKKSFSECIIKRAKEYGIEPIEALLDYCEETGLEVEIAATLLNDELYEQVKDNATGLRLLKK